MFMNWRSHFHKDGIALQIAFSVKPKHSFFAESDKLFLKFI